MDNSDVVPHERDQEWKTQMNNYLIKARKESSPKPSLTGALGLNNPSGDQASSTEDICSYGCGASLPCNNPSCDDVLPCWNPYYNCDSLGCLGEICYVENCTSPYKDNETCCDQECEQGSRCLSPCYSQNCNVPDCDSSCPSPQYNFPQLENPSLELPPNWCEVKGHVLEETVCHCIDPRCLSGSHWPHHVLSSDCLNPNQVDQCLCGSIATPDHCTRSPLNLEHERLSTVLAHSDGERPFLGSEAPSPTPYLSSAATSPDSSRKLSASSKQFSSSTCLWLLEQSLDGVCGQAFETALDLQQHVDRDHASGSSREEDDTNGYFCRWAGCPRCMSRSFPSRPKLKRHAQTHTLYKPFVCATCSVGMKTKDALEKHMRIHTGYRPYACGEPDCGKSFTTSTELKTHMIVHSGRKPHQCHLCGERFADSSNLSKHKKTHFVGMFRCPERECGARMKRWDQMRRHIVSSGHAEVLLKDLSRQKEYKCEMEKEWTKLPDGDKAIKRRKFK